MIRKKCWSRLGAVALAAVIVATVFPAHAHHLIREEQDAHGFDAALAIPRPEISWAVYARLGKSDDVDFFRFRMDQPGKIHLGIFIPGKPKFADYYPTYALVGPGLAAPTEPIPFLPPVNYGAIVVRSRPVPKRQVFFEPFTFTRLYYGVTFTDTEVQQVGDYYLVVWSDLGDFGDYLVSYGTAERWSVHDLIDAYGVVAQVQSGAWGNFRGKP